MDERLIRVETEVEHLAHRVAEFERRLAALENQAFSSAAASGHPVPRAEDMTREADLTGPWKTDLATIVALVGRTLLVIAGAYLLRALTDSDILAAAPGAILGLVFGLTWAVMADRAAARGRKLDGTFHGVAFLLITLPLLFEATTRFHFLDAWAAAAGLAGCTGVALAVAIRRHLLDFAWCTTLGALGTAVALTLFTAELGPCALFLVLLGVATLWLGYVREWTLLRWPVALLADLTIVVISGRAVTSGVNDAPGVALTVQILLLVAYLGSFATRTLYLNRDVIPFEVVQSIAAIVVGLGGAAYVTRTTDVGALSLGLATLALAAGSYGVAIAFVERRQGRRRNFVFYTSAGLVFAMAGWALVLPTPAVGLAYAALGVTSAWAGRYVRRDTFRAHGSIYLVAAVVVSGLLAHVVYGFGLPVAPARAASPAILAVLAACFLAMVPLAPTDEGASSRLLVRVPRLVVLVLGLGGLLGVAVSWLAPALTPGADMAPHAGLISTLRTALLVLSILVLAWAGGSRRLVEGTWLAYSLLALTGLKFLLEDFRTGRPATLFLSFALYGLALIMSPWLCRRTSRATAGRLPDASDHGET